MSAHSRITYPQKNFFNFSILTKLIYIPVNCNIIIMIVKKSVYFYFKNAGYSCIIITVQPCNIFEENENVTLS